MIFRGLMLLARGQKTGIKEFGNTLDSFTASLAPLIATLISSSLVDCAVHASPSRATSART